MSEDIEKLGRKRDELYRQVAEVGDFRRGIISLNYRKCGKKNCACAAAEHAGHPQYLWNTTIKGKSYAKSLKVGPELQKYMDEIGNHNRFEHLRQAIVEINEMICNIRPVKEISDISEMETLKKNLRKVFMKKFKKKVTG
jgi:hypothetical protein